MKEVKTVVIVFIYFVFHISISYEHSHNFTCPSQANWKIRAKSRCNITSKYFCLYNNVEKLYVEGCAGPDWDRKGSKRIFSGDFTRGQCIQRRYQPFVFWTNGSTSDCIYDKSLCIEEGQIIYQDDSTKEDRTCQCDYNKSYSFLNTPRNVCNCIPSEEDCSCYIKSCRVNQTLSVDYKCVQSGDLQNQSCIDQKHYESAKNATQVQVEQNILLLPETTSKPEGRFSTTTNALLCLCVIPLIGVFCAALRHNPISKILQQFIKYLQNSHTDTNADEKEEENSVRENSFDKSNPQLIKSAPIDEDTNAGERDIEYNVHTYTFEERHGILLESTSIDEGTQTDENESDGSIDEERKSASESNFLRLIHLLFRVACPVVRMKLDHAIRPDQLKDILDEHRPEMQKKYRTMENSINDYQWGLLYPEKPVTMVTSENLDIRIMIYLLRSLANIDIGDLYPVQSDTSESAMLARIKYVRNEALRRFEGQPAKDKFNRFWNDIGQAVLKLASQHQFTIDASQEKTQLFGRLLLLNPINIDINRLCKFIDLSERYPAKIFKQIFSEYCTLNEVTIIDVLRAEKHTLYHKRSKTDSCCICKTPVCTDKQVIPETHWEALFKLNEGFFSLSCECQEQGVQCCERFVPTNIDITEMSVSLPLILHSQTMKHYIFSQLYNDNFQSFLNESIHSLYHCVETKKCCQCDKISHASVEKIIFTKKEWNTLFKKIEKKYCKTVTNLTDDCCCLYTIRREIKYTDIDDAFLTKIFRVAGPIGIFSKIEENAFLYFLNWTVCEKPLQSALECLLSILHDKNVCTSIEPFIRSDHDECVSEQTETKKEDAYIWISRHIQEQQETAAERQFQIMVPDQHGYNFKSVQIPEDFSLPHRTKKIIDVTKEENNFLVVVYIITKIVYPLIKAEFDEKCTPTKLVRIEMNLYDQQVESNTQDYKGTSVNRKKKINLTKQQHEQLFPPNKEETRKLDLKLMIYILKEIMEEENTEYVNYLEVIDDVKRKIVQSSSGTLTKKQFEKTKILLSEAVQYLDPKRAEKLSSIWDYKDILK